MYWTIELEPQNGFSRNFHLLALGENLRSAARRSTGCRSDRSTFTATRDGA